MPSSSTTCCKLRHAAKQTRTTCLSECYSTILNLDRILNHLSGNPKGCENTSAESLELLDELYTCRQRYCGGNMGPAADGMCLILALKNTS